MAGASWPADVLAAIALGESVLQEGALGVPEHAACPGPEQTCHSPSRLVPERLGRRGDLQCHLPRCELGDLDISDLAHVLYSLELLV